MPRTAEDVETYLLSLDRRFDRNGSTFLIQATGAIVPLLVTPPIVALRVTIGMAPKGDAREVAFFRKLLELNASDLMHVSYGLDGDTVVLSGALELENLDVNELEAALSDIDLALARHVPTLHDLAGHGTQAAQAAHDA
jgi:hypothetical protein